MNFMLPVLQFLDSQNVCIFHCIFPIFKIISTIKKENETFFLFFIFLKLFPDMKKYCTVVPPKPFPSKDWSCLMFLINNILSQKKIHFLLLLLLLKFTEV